MISAEDRHWQRVPKVNVLSGQRRALPKNIILRGLLALIVLLGAYLFWDQWNTRADINEGIAQKTSDLRRLQGTLAQKRQVIEGLQGQINRLQQQQESIELVTAGGIDWYASVSSLFDAQESGVRFDSVTAEPGGRVVLDGLATDPESRASLSTRLIRIPSPLDFEGIEWGVGSESTPFSATFQVLP